MQEVAITHVTVIDGEVKIVSDIPLSRGFGAFDLQLQLVHPCETEQRVDIANVTLLGSKMLIISFGDRPPSGSDKYITNHFIVPCIKADLRYLKIRDGWVCISYIYSANMVDVDIQETYNCNWSELIFSTITPCEFDLASYLDIEHYSLGICGVYKVVINNLTYWHNNVL